MQIKTTCLCNLYCVIWSTNPAKIFYPLLWENYFLVYAHFMLYPANNRRDGSTVFPPSGKWLHFLSLYCTTSPKFSFNLHMLANWPSLGDFIHPSGCAGTKMLLGEMKKKTPPPSGKLLSLWSPSAASFTAFHYFCICCLSQHRSAPALVYR